MVMMSRLALSHWDVEGGLLYALNERVSGPWDPQALCFAAVQNAWIRATCMFLHNVSQLATGTGRAEGGRELLRRRLEHVTSFKGIQKNQLPITVHEQGSRECKKAHRKDSEFRI